MEKGAELAERRGLRWQLYEDLLTVEINIPIDYILSCIEENFWEICYRYKEILINHKEISEERRRVWEEKLMN